MNFVLVSSLVLLFVHLYLWRRLVHDTALSSRARKLATIAIVGLGLSIPVSFMMRDPDQKPLLLTGNIWLGLMFYLTTLLLTWDAIRLPVRLLQGINRFRERNRPVSDEGMRASAIPPTAVATAAATRDTHLDPAAPSAATTMPPTPTETPTTMLQRREFLARSSATTALLATGTIGVWGTRAALWELSTPEVVIALPQLPKALDGYQIALMSDIHIGATLHGRFLRDLVETTNRFKPDLVAVVGDLVDGSVADLGAHVAELGRLRSRQGTVFVTGNHEYYSGADAWIAFLRKLGVRVLLNEHLVLGDKHRTGAQFDLGGVRDHHAYHFGHPAPDAVMATQGRNPDHALVMLAHQPAQIDDVARTGAGLQLSGHTHGGQLFPFGALTMLVQPYLSGLYRHNDQTQIYVSRGTGFWGPPMRVLAPAEITRIRLVGA